ncbi:MAG: ATP-binding protein [Bacteroidaceae bacterium]|nr:ATP-binding protein [Bacteroidaceae bacterium]
MAQKLFPIGVQDFRSIIEDGFCYVDKTELVYKLVKSGRNAFLSRPRRFGKSLLCTTLKYYMLGERELFRGLAIERLEKDWVRRPVLHIDFNRSKYESVDDLTEMLSICLSQWEEVYGKVDYETSLASRFAGIMRRAHERSGQKVAVIIDEYDKPLLDVMHDRELQDRMRTQLKSFYGQMKSGDADIQFVFLTGVTKFSKVSVFSDLNNIQDISMNDDYAGICGITQEEVDANFGEDIGRMAAKRGLAYGEMRQQLRDTYDGYHFSPCMLDVYNPFSLLQALQNSDLQHYWFASGTPTFLIRLLKNANYDLRRLSGIQVTASRLGDISEPERDPVPILFQSGYLTVKDYDPRFNWYSLDFPNVEVRQGFFDALIPQYNLRTDAYGEDFCIANFVMAVERGDIDGFMERLKALFADIPYTQASDKRRVLEQQYQNVVYIVFTLMGFYTEVEHHTSMGRIDLVVKTPQYIYIMELKVGKGTAEEAMRQIEDSHYADPYAADPRVLYKVGVGFDPDTNNMDRWVIAGGGSKP